jgi:hypothetical protein
MVGFAGNRPIDILQVRAENPFFAGLIIRIVSLPPRQNGAAWQVGDEIGLHGSLWRERDDASVYATVTEIINDSD